MLLIERLYSLEGIMAIPDFQSIMLPMLFLAKDEKIHYFHDAVEQLALEFDLSEKELSILIPS